MLLMAGRVKAKKVSNFVNPGKGSVLASMERAVQRHIQESATKVLREGFVTTN
jgi:hypothetical protein